MEWLTEEQEREIIIRDNVSNGDWDMDMLANEWDPIQLKDWGVDFTDDAWFSPEIDDDTYTKKIEAPIYEMKWENPTINELYNTKKVYELVEKIEASKLSEIEKDFLKMAAYRHCVFDFWKIAEFYSHSSKEMQEMMEDSALIIIDFDKAIEWWYVEVSDNIKKLYSSEYKYV